jgi:DNA-binding HxlR family transcriptional regulator
MSTRYLFTVRKSYEQNCPVARTLDLIGERWTILILRDLLKKGPQRFQDFQDSLAGAAPNTISARLKAMEEQGPDRAAAVQRPPAAARVSPDRARAQPRSVLGALRDWGKRHAAKA